MAIRKMKYMNETQTAEIEALWPEHGEAIYAYVKDCIRAYKIGEAEGSLIVVAAVGIGAGVTYLGKKVYHKLKEKKEEPKPWDKPGRDWEV
jgi:hypothetical protein